REFMRAAEDGGEVTFETLGFAFDRAAGWSRQAAEEWARKHLGLRDLGRTAFLGRLQRPACGLAAFLAEAGCPEAHDPHARPAEEPCCGPWGKWSAALEFVAVPGAPLGGDTHRRGRHGDGGRGRPRCGGAGFELDLSDTAHPEHLPSGLRAALPSRGLVNYFEAQALVQALEALVGDGT